MPRIVVTGSELIKALIRRGGYVSLRANDRGLLLLKTANGHTRRTVIKETDKPIPQTVLEFIAGPTQTNLGIDGLQELLARHQ